MGAGLDLFYLLDDSCFLVYCSCFYNLIYNCNPVKISFYPITGFLACYGNFR